MKKILVVSHERSGTHLLINLINYKNNGDFSSVGFDTQVNNFNKEKYQKNVIEDLLIRSTDNKKILKSHHQIFFVENIIDFLIDRYYIIYIKREIKDTLLSYYKFLSRDKINFPNIDDWVFSNPDIIGKKFIVPYYPDPHVLIDPHDYVDRWFLHTDGWLKYKKNILILNYEEILLSFEKEKSKIESFIGRKISDELIDIKDIRYPNYSPNKGLIGEHKKEMTTQLINKIDNKIKNLTLK